MLCVCYYLIFTELYEVVSSVGFFSLLRKVRPSEVTQFYVILTGITGGCRSMSLFYGDAYGSPRKMEPWEDAWCPENNLLHCSAPGSALAIADIL